MKRGNRWIDLTGARFGMLTALSFYGSSGNGQKRSLWICRCDCGNESKVASGNLRSGHTASCGCARISSSRESSTTHGMSDSLAYKSWANMHKRCANPGDINYPKYGARGISVCDRWMQFSNFYEDMGDRPSVEHSIERKDNNAGYFKDNCKWALPSEQCANRRSTRNLTFDGATYILEDWAKITGMDHGVIRNRLRRGWSVADALTRPRRLPCHLRDNNVREPIYKNIHAAALKAAKERDE